jgi:hypothetical protein
VRNPRDRWPFLDGKNERRFREFSKESIIDWHRRRGLLR